MFTNYRKIKITELKTFINDYKNKKNNTIKVENKITFQILELNQNCNYNNILRYLESFNFKICCENKII